MCCNHKSVDLSLIADVLDKYAAVKGSLITTTEDGIRFQFPEYPWTDHYPHCDGESDRWDAHITGIRDEIFYPFPK